MRFTLIAAAIIFGYLLAGILHFQRRRPAYSGWKHTISELGETGAADGARVNYFLFLPIGLALLLLAGITYIQDIGSPALMGLSACLGIGYAVAALFPCDQGSPIYGSPRQTIHNIGGIAEYAGGAYFINVAGFGVASLIIVGAAFFLSFSTPIRGGVQRVAEVILFSSLVLTSR